MVICTTFFKFKDNYKKKEKGAQTSLIFLLKLGLVLYRGFINDWTTTGLQDQHKCCLTGPFSTYAGFIDYLFALNIKISWFEGPAKKEINWSCSKITGHGPTD